MDHAGVGLVWPWQPPSRGWGGDGAQPCTGSYAPSPPPQTGCSGRRLQRGELGEGSGSPGAWPNHRYVMRRFLLWRHFCGIRLPRLLP